MSVRQEFGGQGMQKSEKCVRVNVFECVPVTEDREGRERGHLGDAGLCLPRVVFHYSTPQC